MSAETSEGSVSIGKLILIPALITLAITIIRLVGELQHWNPTLFNPSAGGGGALVGITWLVPILGIYFAIKLCRAGAGPERVGRVFLFVLLAIVVFFALFAIGAALKLQPGSPVFAAIGAAAAIISIAIMAKPWPALFKTLLAYGYAARIPVAILMIFAIHGNWGTHYDVAPPGEFPEMNWLAKWVLIGAFPQLLGWISFTVVFGSLFGAIAAALTKRGKAREHAAATS
ncbi:MAG TPA: hypothetical protein VN345_08650 [Blastocatellia bacterium]|jgi:hypothetical protein|nr:hypothetical protein [Blastocatellia bacterium]